MVILMILTIIMILLLDTVNYTYNCDICYTTYDTYYSLLYFTYFTILLSFTPTPTYFVLSYFILPLYYDVIIKTQRYRLSGERSSMPTETEE